MKQVSYQTYLTFTKTQKINYDFMAYFLNWENTYLDFNLDVD